MGFRQIYIKQAKKLSLKLHNIEITKIDGTILELPVSDISSVFVEDPNAIVTAHLLTFLSENNVSITFCNGDYFPSAQVLPLNTYYSQVAIYKLQTEQLPSKKDKLWQMIVSSKITNQRRVIELTTNNLDTIRLLDEHIQNIKSGDKTGQEGPSARLYFSELFGQDFIRFGDSPISKALNYGYSILHGSIARQLVCNGLNTNLGVWHDSEQNAYNLASDFIEPFRPLVDYYVFWHLDQIANPLSSKTRMDLINLLNEEVVLDGKTYKVEYAISLFILSYIEYLKSGDINVMHFPEIKETQYVGY
jgi:CRISPR-associated protein Cas1